MEPFKFDKRTDALFETVLRLKTVADAEVFFRDLCTVSEIKDMRDRWEMARLIADGVSYREISLKLKVSTATVCRVASWLNNGTGGYKLMMKGKS
ncbi:hypothetical protein COY93_03805 [Candidatus Uhrbacteria bacterium CG_4_10_14_0_8_um_filter_58_22]|uniref:DNA-binding transcriptional regulator n=1 Tax=Candidatus Uhrbacteria bacterium CG_4_10_14_0_8_um_filter_58_22 TaxID=1975029 RepID=A0A2M7QA84_9BACT|nr:MAG: hypothetical protein AUJ19_00640 [Parcubacteria group bacterium CG1_02_58_44]PIY62116.1 MAG: hypothetical protein COY93_03805 [Candidatus Uhrbacteria bacterium CG_4_10_14_0_8_um_filter_58_22]